MTTPAAEIHHFANPRVLTGAPYSDSARGVLDQAGCDSAWREITTWPGYAPTPLRPLVGLAAALDIGALWLKDEAGRFGLGSFKALGGAYAVQRLLAAEVAARLGIASATARDLAAGRHRAATRDITVTTATDGNHGRSVAWGAETFGCRAVIFIHATVSEGRAEAIARYGAEVVRVAGNYDQSVREAAAQAARNGWHVVSDTSWPGYSEVPRDVMHGYTVMTRELIDQLPDDTVPPSHVFVQAGVGGLAAAVIAPLWMRWGAARPRFVAVEPLAADCCYRSAVAGRPTPVPGDLDTLMAGLAAGEVSILAWDLLDRAVDDFLVVPDEAAATAMRVLAEGAGGDAPMVLGEAGVGGLAGLSVAAADPGLRAALALDASSQVVLIGSEGATDPAVYERIVGRAAAEVAGA